MRIASLQKLQNRAARIVSGSPYDAPSVPLRKELGWLSIKEMIVKETSTMVYKSLNDLAPQYLSDLFVRLSDFQTRELRNSKGAGYWGPGNELPGKFWGQRPNFKGNSWKQRSWLRRPNS